MHALGLTAESWLYALVFRTLAEDGHRDLFVETMRQIVRMHVKVDESIMSIVREYAAGGSGTENGNVTVAGNNTNEDNK
ncbi:hypothetical protein GGF37_005827 [Kickxella alabastrina]|nr:hypothetical protein GGF37_005827 [Kickxella alabastrina]